MKKKSKILILGASGLVGSAILRELQAQGFTNILTPSSRQLDLTNQQKTHVYLQEETPDYVFMCAGEVGGINANSTRPADFIYNNIIMNANVIEGCFYIGVDKLVVLGSSCIYPKFSLQPIKEEYLLTGELEPTNEAYAVAKIAGLKMVEAYRKQYGCNFISLMPCNLFGINDNYDLESCHVVPALIRKMHEAKKNNTNVTVWGSGLPKREMMLADDMASAAIFMAANYNEDGHVNVGTGWDISIKGLVEAIADVVGFKGDIVFDSSKPDGTPKKLLDIDKIKEMGWSSKYSLIEGLKIAYDDFLKNLK